MKNAHNRSAAHSRGSALLIVLAFLLLLVTLTVAFLSRATFERQLSNASFNQGKVDLAGQGAISAVIGDLQQEIVAGSNVGAGTTIPSVAGGYYYPNSPLTVVPCPVVPVNSFNYTASSIVGSGMEDLVKISQRGTTFWSGANYSASGPQRAASVSTGAASLNGRSVTAVRWNAPLLMNPVNVATTPTDFTPPSAFKNNPPDWIYVARDGSNPTGTALDSSYVSSPNVSPTATPTKGTFGTNPITQRYAYAIYDEGGTLDMNLAGSPVTGTSGTPATVTYSTNQPYKNALAYADLTQLPALSSLTAANKQAFVNAIVGWRNYASSALSNSTGLFPNTYTFTAVNAAAFDYNVIFNPGGFLGVSGYVSPTAPKTTTALRVGPSATGSANQSDNAFVSRQQLLQFFLQGLGQNSTFLTNSGLTLANLESLLPYLGTFSRDLSQPSYAPDPNRPVVLATASGGNDMAGQATNSTGQNILNPAFLSVTAPSAFMRNDGTTAVIGDPLVKKRFALNRLAWLTYLGPITSTTSPRTASSLTAPSSTLFTNGNSNYDYDIYLLENTYGFPVSFLAQGTAANVYKYFGLSWVSDSRPNGISGTGDSQMKWVYNHTVANPAVGTTTSPITALPAGSTRILTLSQVAAAGREPDFFELLKAAMTVGSLGKPCTAANGTGNSWDFQNSKDVQLDAQVIQIGANIIAQFQTSQVPPRILFNDGTWTQPQEYRGVEDLPYLCQTVGGLTRLQDTNPSFTAASPTGPNNGNPTATTTPLPVASSGVAAFFQIPSIWDPHALNPNVSGTSTTAASAANIAAYAATMGPRPVNFRIFAIDGNPNMTGPPSSADPNAITMQAAANYANNTTTNVNPGYQVCPLSYTTGTALQQSLSLNPPGSGLPDTSLTFSIPITYSGSGAATVTWRPDLFREPTILNKPNVPMGSNLSLGPNNVLLNAPYKALLATQIANGTLAGGAIGLENSLGDTNPSYTSVGVTDYGNSNGTKPAYLGIFLGAFPLSWNWTSGGTTYIISGAFGVMNLAWWNAPLTYRIQCQDPATGNWETYDEKYMHATCYGFGTAEYGVNPNGAPTLTSQVMQNAITGDQDYLTYLDPRTARFCFWASDPASSSVVNNGVWEWPLMVRSRNSGMNISGTQTMFNRGNLTGWAAPTNATNFSSTSPSAYAAAQNATWTFRPDEESGFSIGYNGNSVPPSSLGWYKVATTSDDWQIGNLCQNDPVSSLHSSINSFGFFTGPDFFGVPGGYNTGSGHNSVTIPGPNEFYADPDGVVRRATAGYLQPGSDSFESLPTAQRPAGQPSGVPLSWAYDFASPTATIPGQAVADVSPTSQYSNNLPCRPVMLNRPFRSVAELGHVFTGTPWRNLDFSTPESGSSALLDVFCINDTNDPGGLVAGKINLNTRQSPVLQAVIAGAYQDTFNPTTAYTAGSGTSATATADNIAKALVARTTDTTDLALGSGPLRNISELVGKYVSNVAAANAGGSTTTPPYDGGQTYSGFSGAPTTASGTAPSSTPANLSSVLVGDTTSSNYYSAANIQRYRESTIRALSAVGTTRVWNLMIDVIAQTGRFPSSASSLSSFNVEGERRYWVHVAIDRYTGKVLDEQVEEVKE